MMLTLDEMNTLISKMFLSSQLENIGWDSLKDTDKEAALSNAHIELNRLQFIGVKADPNQEDAFPRILYGELVETPEPVKMALCRLVYDFVRINNNEDIFELVNNGITSRKIHNISETYDLTKLVDFNIHYRKYLTDWIYRGARW